LPSKLPEDSVGSALVRSPTLEYIIGEDATDDLNKREDQISKSNSYSYLSCMATLLGLPSLLLPMPLNCSKED
jgi:hypothetical protein